jgi:hypothetical protein
MSRKKFERKLPPVKSKEHRAWSIERKKITKTVNFGHGFCFAEHTDFTDGNRARLKVTWRNSHREK